MAEKKKLEISCGRTACTEGLHCYRRTKREALAAARSATQFTLLPNGNARSAVVTSSVDRACATLAAEEPPRRRWIRQCKECGAELVDWERVHGRDLNDIDNTFNALRTEWIRHHFWHRHIHQRALDYAFKLGSIRLQERMMKRLRSSVGRPANSFDGRQTPFGIKKEEGPNILHFAQHATATCCRECIEGWHGIPRDRALTADELTYLAALAVRYLRDRLPNLPELGGTAAPPAELPRNEASDAPVTDANSGNSAAATGEAKIEPILTRRRGVLPNKQAG